MPDRTILNARRCVLAVAMACCAWQAPAQAAQPPGAAFRDEPAGGAPGPEMVVVPAGTFRIGSPGAEPDRQGDEGPQAEIRIDAPFALGRTEVTVEQFGRFVVATGYETDAERLGGCFAYVGAWEAIEGTDWRKPPGVEQDGRHPVVCVSWNDAVAYARWLSAQTGERYRLPTEAEWEYAARGGSGASRPWGDDPHAACEHANVADSALKRAHPGDWPAHDCDDGFVYTAPVASLGANGFGLHDMAGNVWEWTCSGYQQRYAGAERECADPLLTGQRVFRGGSWYNFPAWVRSAARSAFPPDFRTYLLGFRVQRAR